MQTLSLRQEFDCPLELLLRAREERYKHLDKFPELQNVHIISEERDGHIIKQVRHIDIGESMPSVLATVLPSGASVLHESSEFDLNTNTHTFTVTPGGNLGHLITVEGLSTYFKIDEERAGRSYDLKFTSRAFLVSSLVESAVSDIYKKNSARDQESINGFIKLLREEESETLASGGGDSQGGEPTADSAPA